MSCTPEIRKKELRAGFLTSMAMGSVMSATLFYASHRGWNTDVAYPVIMFTTNVIGFALDILVAKRCFNSWSDPKTVEIYGYRGADWGRRAAWYGRSVLSMSFVRNLMLSLLDVLVISNLSKIAVHKLRGTWLAERVPKKVLDPVVTILMGLLTFNLFVNALRFSWAYQSEPDTLVTVVLAMWLVFVLYFEFEGGIGADAGAGSSGNEKTGGEK